MLIFSYGNLWAKITNNSERTKYPAMFFWILHKQKGGMQGGQSDNSKPMALSLALGSNGIASSVNKILWFMNCYSVYCSADRLIGLA